MSKIEKALRKAKLNRWQPKNDEQRMPPILNGKPVQITPEMPRLNAPIVTLEKEHLEKNRLMTFIDNSRAVDFYNIVATRLLESTEHKVPVTILVASTLDGEGKTVTAINLSSSIARATRKNVFLVDADLRNPGVQKYLGCHLEKGLSDYLQGNEDLAELIFNPGLANLFVLQSGKPFHGSSDIFSSVKMKNLFQEIRYRYPDSYVICDSPPLLLGSDTVFISSYVDGIVLVVESGRTPKDQILEAINMLENRNIYGLVMNKAEMNNNKYYYYNTK